MTSQPATGPDDGVDAARGLGTFDRSEAGDHRGAGDVPLLEARGIVKRYGAVTALDGVDFRVDSGEVVGLVGDNGAGKSTLIKILSGALGPDEGRIYIRGQETRMTSPREAQHHGIETVYQDLALFDELSVSDNLFVGRERVGPLRLLRKNAMRQFTEETIARLGVDVPDTTALVRNLSGGQRQAVAVARSVAFGSRVVILDEPTSALSKGAADRILEIVRELKQHDVGAIFIGHNLEHVTAVSDRVVVLRQGRVEGLVDRVDFDTQRIVSLMVGA